MIPRVGHLSVFLITMLGVCSAYAEEQAYHASVFDRLFGGFLDSTEPNDIRSSTRIPFEYTDRQSIIGGDQYLQANIVLVDKRTGKRSPIVLVRSNTYAYDDISLRLLRCWQKNDVGIIPDARALVVLSHVNVAAPSTERAWLLSQHPSLNTLDSRYEFILQACSKIDNGEEELVSSIDAAELSAG